MKKVLLLCGSLNIGGTERNVLNIARLLNKNRFTVTIYCFYIAGLLFEQTRSEGIEVIVNNRIRSRYDIIRNVYKLLRYLKKQKMDIVHCFGYPTIYYGIIAASAAKTPVLITTIQDYDVWKSWGELYWDNIVYSNVDLMIADGEGSRKFAINYQKINGNKIVTLYDGANLDELKPSSQLYQKCIDLRLDDKLPVVSVIARLDEKKKGQTVFIEAISQLRRRWAGLKNANFLIVGGGKDEALLRQHAKKHGVKDWINFTGFRTDLADILALTDILVISSRWESIPKILVEGMATGKAIVSTKVGDIPELLGDGFLIPKDDPQAMADTIEKLVTDKVYREKMSMFVLNYVKKNNLTVESSVMELERLYEQAFQKRTSGRQVEKKIRMFAGILYYATIGALISKTKNFFDNNRR